jgi:SPP1 family predicted phage head-tail adaptor
MKDAGAGAMDYRVAFDAPVRGDNGGGGETLSWAEQLQAFAQFTFLRGGEVVLAARLAGRQPLVVKIRASASAAAIRTDWRMRDVRSGVEYNIRSIVPSDDRQFFQLTCESGVAV